MMLLSERVPFRAAAGGQVTKAGAKNKKHNQKQETKSPTPPQQRPLDSLFATVSFIAFFSFLRLSSFYYSSGPWLPPACINIYLHNIQHTHTTVTVSHIPFSFSLLMHNVPWHGHMSRENLLCATLLCPPARRRRNLGGAFPLVRCRWWRGDVQLFECQRQRRRRCCLLMRRKRSGRRRG